MTVYNLDFDFAACMVALFTLILVIIKKDLKRLENMLYVLIVADNLFACIFDVYSAYAIMNTTWVPRALNMGLSYAYLIFHACFAPLFFGYVMLVSGIVFSKKYQNINIFISGIPWFISLIAIALNPIFHWVFYLDEKGAYFHGKGIYTMYISAAIYLIGIFYIIIRFKKNFSIAQRFCLAVFWILALSTLVYQFFNPGVLMEMLGQAMVCLGVAVTITDEEALYDPSTHVYNRITFQNDMNRLLKSAADCSVCFVRITNGAKVASSLGLERTNTELTKVADFLRRIAKHRTRQSVYDLGNYNFAILHRSSDKKEIKELSLILEERFKKEWASDNFRIIFDAQIIVIHVPTDFNDMDSIMAIGDRNYIHSQETKVFSGEGLNQIKRYHSVERAVSRGLENHNFKVYYQPIWDATSNKIHSCEALLRLFDDEIGFVSPDEFILVAEENGSIVEIGEYVFDEVCRFIVESNLLEKEIEFVEVNLSTVQCLQSNLIEQLSNTLEKYNLSPSAINIEITETAAVENEDVLKDTMDKLHEMGFSVSMDDFGTGYSNLMSIFNLNFEIIKIDKSILWNADDNIAGDIILENTVNTIKQMDRRIVCEGVESLEQKEKLTRMGVDYCQGYHFLRPVKGEEFVAYVDKFNFKKDLAEAK